MPSLTVRGWMTWRRVLVLGLWLVSVGLAFLVGAWAHKHRARIRRFLSGQEAAIQRTGLYNLQLDEIAVPGGGWDGGIAALDDGLLFANRSGELWFVDRQRALHPLAPRVPINVDAFVSDPYNENTVFLFRFAVKDLLVMPRPDGFRLLASHSYWYPDDDCYTLRVSAIDMDLERARSGALGADAPWTTVFESTPCRQLTVGPNGRTRNPTIGAGGRLVAVSDQEIVVTLGLFGPEVLEKGAPLLSQELDNSYGKTILVNLATGQSRPFTLGHRNPQGLALGPDSRLWLTEHGPEGGDELNLLTDGANYGYPLVSYGTEYGSMVWGPNPHQGRHDGYAQPIFVFPPKTGVSQLLVLQGTAFPYWQGDLMITSLNGGSLFRVRIEEGRALFTEVIPIGHRIRDVAETADGSIVLKTDDDLLIYVRPLDATAAASEDLEPDVRGKILAGQCTGCHTFERGGAAGIGPNLWGIVGQRIAGVEGFTYSDGLRAIEGRWTPDALRSYMADPDRFAPGTTMERTARYTDRELDDLIAYMETLR